MKQFAVIGLGRFGRSIASTLHDLGHQVLAIDIENDKVKKFVARATRAIQCDATNEAALRATGIRNCEVVVVAVGSLATTTRVILLLKELKIEYVVARADDKTDAKIMQLTGADKIILPEYDMGKKLARSLIFPFIKEYVEITENIGLIEIQPLPEMINFSLRNLQLGEQYGVHIIAIRDSDGELNIIPCGADVIRGDDTLLVIGATQNLKNLQEKL